MAAKKTSARKTTPEQRKAREARGRKLLAQRKKKLGLGKKK